MEDDRLASVRQRRDLQGLQTPTPDEVGPACRHKAVHQTVGVHSLLVGRTVWTTDVLDNPEIAITVVLDPFIATTTYNATEIFHLRGEIQGGLPHAALRAEFRREQQALRKGVPGRAVKERQGFPSHVSAGHERNAMHLIGIEVDARDIAPAIGEAADASFMPLKEEV